MTAQGPEARDAGVPSGRSPSGLTHLDAHGNARMVDVSERQVSARSAVATARVLLRPDVLTAVTTGEVPKGDVAAVARVAGIMAAKRTPDLIPMCHPLSVSGVSVEVSTSDDAVELSARVRTTDRTGVEMEALTAVSVAGLAVIDMVKALDPAAMLTDVRVESKAGGRSGDWHRADELPAEVES